LRRVGQFLGLYLSIGGVLCATGIISTGNTTGITSCESSDPTLTQCLSPNTFFTTPLTLDWGTAFGPAKFEPGGNPFDLTQGPLTTVIAGINVSVTVGPDFQVVIPPNADGSPGPGDPNARFLARTDNEVFVFDNTRGIWVVATSALGSLNADLTYGGHFNAPGVSQPNVLGTNLLEMFNNSNFGTGSYVITFNPAVAAVGLLISVQGSAFNTNFDATITATDQNSNVSTYVIHTVGVGAGCASLNNQVLDVATDTLLPAPVACNDAPFIGIRAAGTLTSQQISSIVISASTGGAADSVLIGPLEIEAFAPEPSVVFLCGGGLLLIGVLRRRQSLAAGSRR
jgi:hypothetical protein